MRNFKEGPADAPNVLWFATRPCESRRKQTRRGPNEEFGVPTTLTTRLRTNGDSELRMASSRRTNGLHCRRSQRHCRQRRRKRLPGRHEASRNRRCSGGSRPVLCACRYGPEGDLGRDARQETCSGATDPNRHSSSEWRRTTHRSTMERRGMTSQTRRRRRRHCAHWRTSPAR